MKDSLWLVVVSRDYKPKELEYLKAQKQFPLSIRMAYDGLAFVQNAQNAEPMSPEAERQAKIDHMKDVKTQVKTQAIENAMNQEAYVMLSFDDFANKREFMDRMGYPADLKFIKGEEFSQRVEVIE